MDQRTSRWCQVVWIDRDELDSIHHRERIAATRSTSRKMFFEEKGLGTWMRHDLIEAAIDRIFPDGYWPKGMDESSWFKSIEEFDRKIYPIWKGIESKDIEAEKLLTNEQVAAQNILSDCLTLHKIEVSIHGSSIKPMRVSVDQERMMDIRRKAARFE